MHDENEPRSFSIGPFERRLKGRGLLGASRSRWMNEILTANIASSGAYKTCGEEVKSKKESHDNDSPQP